MFSDWPATADREQCQIDAGKRMKYIRLSGTTECQTRLRRLDSGEDLAQCNVDTDATQKQLRKDSADRILFAVGRDIYEGFNVLAAVVDVM